MWAPRMGDSPGPCTTFMRRLNSRSTSCKETRSAIPDLEFDFFMESVFDPWLLFRISDFEFRIFFIGFSIAGRRLQSAYPLRADPRCRPDIPAGTGRGYVPKIPGPE